MKIEIKKVNGKWLINDKQYADLDYTERMFFDEFLIAMRWEKECEEFDKQQKKVS